MLYVLYGWTTEAITAYNTSHGMTEEYEDDLYNVDYGPFIQDLENDEIHLQDYAEYITDSNNLKELNSFMNQLVEKGTKYQHIHVWDVEEEMWLL